MRSALGEHRNPGRALSFPEGRQWVAAGLGHFDLLDGGEVYEVIRGWLSD